MHIYNVEISTNQSSVQPFRLHKIIMVGINTHIKKNFRLHGMYGGNSYNKGA